MVLRETNASSDGPFKGAEILSNTQSPIRRRVQYTREQPYGADDAPLTVTLDH